MVDEISLEITLVNPFAQAMAPIRLPHFEENVSKVILSADPALNPTSYMVVAIYNSTKLAVLRGGEEDWNCIRLPDKLFDSLTDVKIYKGQIYAVSVWGKIVSINVSKCVIKSSHSQKSLDVRVFMTCSREFRFSVLFEKSFRVYKVEFSDIDGCMVKYVELLEPIEHVCCAVVCKQWQSLAKQYTVATQRWSKVLPMLMVSAGPSSAMDSVSEEKREGFCQCVIYSRLRVFRPHISNPFDKYQAHIVESTKGDLWHVLTCGETFKVYNVVFSDADGSMVKHVEVETIGDEALFLGKNYSFSLSASKFPGCQPNSIYYTGDSDTFVIRIFDVELGTDSAKYYPYPSSYGHIPPGLWITPQFKGLC
ncbi:hypothetical protein ACLB2K_036533 [Fragaria x ananassa]